MSGSGSRAPTVAVLHQNREWPLARAGRSLTRRSRWWAKRLSNGPHRISGTCQLGPRASVVVQRPGTLEVSDGVTIAGDFHCFVAGRLAIGRGVFVGRWCAVSALVSVTLGDNVRLGERVSIHDENHASAGHDYLASPIVVGAGAWIGAGVAILPGVTIGEGAVVGANSVVTSSVPPGAVAVGAPARQVGRSTLQAD